MACCLRALLVDAGVTAFTVAFVGFGLLRGVDGARDV
jgi:hypothetical protein